MQLLLTFYHTIMTFNDPKEEGFEKHYEKRRKCLLPAFSSFPTVFSTPSQREIVILVMFVVCKCFQFGHVQKFVIRQRVNLNKAKILSTGKGLTHSHTMTPFDTPGKQAF